MSLLISCPVFQRPFSFLSLYIYNQHHTPMSKYHRSSKSQAFTSAFPSPPLSSTLSPPEERKRDRSYLYCSNLSPHNATTTTTAFYCFLSTLYPTKPSKTKKATRTISSHGHLHHSPRGLCKRRDRAPLLWLSFLPSAKCRALNRSSSSSTYRHT